MDETELDPKAEAVALELLDRSGTALVTGDFDLFAGCFALPKVMETTAGREELADRDALQAMFERMCDHYRANTVTQLIRYPVAAWFRTTNEIEFIHVTHLMSGDRRIRPPYRTRSRLRFQADGWRSYYSSYDIDTRTLQGRALTRIATTELSALVRPEHDKE